jgi:hypothetical protein
MNMVQMNMLSTVKEVAVVNCSCREEMTVSCVVCDDSKLKRKFESSKEVLMTCFLNAE